MQRRTTAFLTVAVIAVGVGVYGLRQERPTKAATPESQTANTQNINSGNNGKPDAAFDKSRYSLSDPTSIWVVINKKRPLNPRQYVPAVLVVPDIKLRSNITSDERQVRNVNAAALKTLSDAARKDDITLTLESGYRSYGFQSTLYNRYVSQQGKDVADTQSARAGYSEHQSGLAADLGGVTKPACNVEACFSDTSEGKWIAANAYKYGFIIRYPAGKTPVTGYTYEPWHLRYVGTDLSTEMHNTGIQTLEEFFGLVASPDYN
jgi:D-alanyl-D-alanine carboxypeptidase